MIRKPNKIFFLSLILTTLFVLFVTLRVRGYILLLVPIVLAILLTKEYFFEGNQSIPESWRFHVHESLKSLWAIALLIFILTIFLFPFYIHPIMKIKAEENEIVLSEIVKNITANATTDIEKAKAIYDWFDSDFGNIQNVWNRKILFQVYPLQIYLEPPYLCIRLIGHKYPLWILTSRCGACDEYSLLYMEMANEAGLKVRSIHNHGENHNWDEVFIGGRWIIVDPSARLFDPNPSVYETRRHLNVSYVFALYQDGNIEDVTERYTSVGTVRVKVIDNKGNAVPNATVIVDSQNYNPTGQFTGLTCITDGNGECVLQIGGGKYTIRAVDNRLFPHFAKITLDVKENTTIPITLTLRWSVNSLLYLKLPQTANLLISILTVVGLSLVLWYSIVAYIALSRIGERERT